MAYASGWFTQTLLYSLLGTTQTGTPTSIVLTGADANLKLSLLNASPTSYVAPINTVSATLGVWANTDEVTGTGWATGGVDAKHCCRWIGTALQLRVLSRALDLAPLFIRGLTRYLLPVPRLPTLTVSLSITRQLQHR